MLPLAASAAAGIASVSLVGHAGTIGASLAFLLGCATLFAGTSRQLQSSALAPALGALSPLRSRAAIVAGLLAALLLPAAPAAAYRLPAHRRRPGRRRCGVARLWRRPPPQVRREAGMIMS